jgi:hypothetical protein
MPAGQLLGVHCFQPGAGATLRLDDDPVLDSPDARGLPCGAFGLFAFKP